MTFDVELLVRGEHRNWNKNCTRKVEQKPSETYSGLLEDVEQKCKVELSNKGDDGQVY